jgi:hypothetical protein
MIKHHYGQYGRKPVTFIIIRISLQIAFHFSSIFAISPNAVGGGYQVQ